MKGQQAAAPDRSIAASLALQLPCSSSRSARAAVATPGGRSGITDLSLSQEQTAGVADRSSLDPQGGQVSLYLGPTVLVDHQGTLQDALTGAPATIDRDQLSR